MKPGDFLNLTDGMIREYNRIGMIKVDAEVMRNYARTSYIFNIIVSGKLRGFTIICPNCGDVYTISLREYNYDKPINCYTCGHEYKQCDCIMGVVSDE